MRIICILKECDLMTKMSLTVIHIKDVPCELRRKEHRVFPASAHPPASNPLLLD